MLSNFKISIKFLNFFIFVLKVHKLKKEKKRKVNKNLIDIFKVNKTTNRVIFTKTIANLTLIVLQIFNTE